MHPPSQPTGVRRRWLAPLLTAVCLGVAPEARLLADQAPTKSRLPESRPALSSAELAAQAAPAGWKTASRTPATPRDIDQLIAREQQQLKTSPTPRTSDEQFLRRVTLDLTGRLPDPADVEEFAAATDPNKRARLIDSLLDSEEFARHWGRYWRDVLLSRATAMQVFIRLPRTVALETWLVEQFQANKSWADITRALLTAEGALSLEDPTKNGQVGFLLAHFGPDAASERAAETSRIFLGIQIQCAQCHDHPLDIWRRDQFHQLAAFFGRTRERPMRGTGQVRGIQLVSAPAGEHRMPNLQDPKQSTVMHPRFLLGQEYPQGKDDRERRQALADFVTSKDNYWFAAAFVNRVWGELMGQAFCQPVDDLGPQKDVLMLPVLLRAADSFRATDYNIKALFRLILNTDTYQRQTRLGESSDQHLLFAAAYPTRLRADALWQSLVHVLGTLQGPPPPGRRPQQGQAAAMFFGRFFTFENIFKRQFDFDPSLKADEVEGNISQALLLMNNPVLDGRIQARGTNLLARVLKAYPKDDDALRILYLRTLARKPTDRELEKCRKYLATVGNRTEAFEDLLWALLNSTEFQTKR